MRRITTLDGEQPEVDSDLGCSSNATAWACVYTHPQAERWASQNLQAAGYRPYLPLVAVRVRDRVVPSMFHVKQAPLFPRYLFLPFDHRGQSWTPIREVPGVISLLHTKAGVQYVTPGAVEALQASEAARAVLPESTLWQAGAACRVALGPFQGREAVVVEATDTRAVVVMLVFGGLREVTVNVEALASRDE